MTNANANAQHYEDSDEFFELFAEDTFDEERTTGSVWQGIVRGKKGKEEVFAQYTYDEGCEGSGVGWYK